MSQEIVARLSLALGLVAVAALLVPVKKDRATWLVSVGDQPAKQVTVAGGDLTIPINEISNRQATDGWAMALKDRVIVATASATLSCVAATILRWRRSS